MQGRNVNGIHKFIAINSFDFSPIQQMDPSLGYSLVFQNQFNFIIKIQNGQKSFHTLPNQQIMKLKLLILVISNNKGSQKSPQQIKIELLSDNDLFFNFIAKINYDDFKSIKQKQHFFINFKQFPNVIIKNLLKIQKQPQTLLLYFTIISETQGKLDMIQLTEFKNHEIMSFVFNKASEEYIRQTITYRYLSIRSKISLMQSRLSDINQIVRLKNPSLLLHIQRKMLKKK